MYATGAGNLEAVGVKRIFHIPTVNWEKNERLTLPEINMTVVKAMELLRTEGLQSIAFPLLGTGTVGLDVARVTEEMSEGIVHMEKDYPELAGALVLLKHSVFESVKDSIRGSYELIELEQ